MEANYERGGNQDVITITARPIRSTRVVEQAKARRGPAPANEMIRRPCGARCLSIARMKQIRLLAMAARGGGERGCLASLERERHLGASNRIIVTTVTALAA